MKKCWILLLAALLLTGCKAEQTIETVTDEYIQPAMAVMQSAVFTLPQEASVAVLQSEENGTIYLCDGYTVTIQTFPAGDLEATLRETTGFSKEELTLMQTQSEGVDRIQCVWSAAGEEETQIGRLALLDDGAYHYVLSCMANASDTAELQPVWQELFESFRLISPENAYHTGS